MITIFADASFCHETRSAGWGAWAKSDGAPSRTWSGPARRAAGSASEAELMALCHAVECVRDAGWITAGQHLMLQSDSARALQVLMQRAGAREKKHPGGISVQCGRITPTPCEEGCAGWLLAAAGGARLIVRHVKGHCEGSGRSWVNRECDRLARASMRAVRQEMMGGSP